MCYVSRLRNSATQPGERMSRRSTRRGTRARVARLLRLPGRRYCPYGLRIAVPAMAGEHLLAFGWIEAIVTALVFRYLQKQAPELIEPAGRA